MVIDLDVGPELDDLAGGGDEVGLAAGELNGAHALDGDTVGVDDFVVWVCEEFKGEGLLGAEGFVAIDGIEGDADYGSVEGGVPGLIALEVVGLDGAALCLVLGIEVEDDPLAFEV